MILTCYSPQRWKTIFDGFVYSLAYLFIRLCAALLENCGRIGMNFSRKVHIGPTKKLNFSSLSFAVSDSNLEAENRAIFTPRI